MVAAEQGSPFVAAGFPCNAELSAYEWWLLKALYITPNSIFPSGPVDSFWFAVDIVAQSGVLVLVVLLLIEG